MANIRLAIEEGRLEQFAAEFKEKTKKPPAAPQQVKMAKKKTPKRRLTEAEADAVRAERAKARAAKAAANSEHESASQSDVNDKEKD